MVPQSLLREIWEGYDQKSSAVSLLLAKPTDMRELARAVIVQELLTGRGGVWTQWRLYRAQLLAGQLGPAQRTIESLMRCYRPDWPRAIDPDLMTELPDATGSDWKPANKVVAEYAYLCCLRGRVGDAIGHVREWLLAKPDTYRKERLPLLVSLAQCRVANGDPAGAEKDVENFFRLVPRTTSMWDYDSWAQACLVRGFLRQDRSDEAGAIAAWQMGSCRPLGVGGALDILHASILGSLADQLSSSDSKDFLVDLFRGLPPDQYRKVWAASQLLDYKFVTRVLKTSWRSTEGRALARKIAYRQMPFHEMVRETMVLITVGFVREGAFGGHLTAEQHVLVRRWAVLSGKDLREGRIGTKQLLPLFLAWNGASPLLSWKLVAPKFSAEARALTAYILGHRCRTLKKTRQAQAYFREALKLAGKNDLLRRLAQAELKPPKTP